MGEDWVPGDGMMSNINVKRSWKHVRKRKESKITRTYIQEENKKVRGHQGKQEDKPIHPKHTIVYLPFAKKDQI